MAEKPLITANRAKAVQNPRINETTSPASARIDPIDLIGMARSCLFRMAANCLTITRNGHAWDLEVIRADLDEAREGMAPGAARDTVGRVCQSLRAADPQDRKLSLDDLGRIYHLAEMRLAGVELAAIEARCITLGVAA